MERDLGSINVMYTQFSLHHPQNSIRSDLQMLLVHPEHKCLKLSAELWMYTAQYLCELHFHDGALDVEMSRS